MRTVAFYNLESSNEAAGRLEGITCHCVVVAEVAQVDQVISAVDGREILAGDSHIRERRTAICRVATETVHQEIEPIVAPVVPADTDVAGQESPIDILFTLIVRRGEAIEAQFWKLVAKPLCQ